MTNVPGPIVVAMGAEPTDEQWRAISMPLEPYVVVAGAGSGKTSVMAARVAYLALVALGSIDADHGGVLPGNVLCLTFTNKATENFQTRLRKALLELDLPEGEEPEVLNYHGFAASLLDRHGLLAGVEPGAHVLSAAQRNEVCARVLDEMTFDHASATYQPSLISKILELDEQAMNHLVTPQQIVAFNEMRMEQLKGHRSDRAYRAAQERIELARAAARYRELKRELGLMDFGDQIELALRVVEQHPDVAAGYRERFAAVLFDEYQDTNVAQAKLMRAIFGGGHPVTAVGDPDQNIYAWRGASLYNLLEFPRQFPRSDGSPARKLPLYTNFRSGARILEAADTLIAPLPADQRPDPDKRLVVHPPNGEGTVSITRHLDEWTEASFIVDRVVELHKVDGNWSDVAVLCRTSRLFQLLQRAFSERDVPVEVLGLAGLLKLPEIVEVLAYARAVLDPTASVALARILMGPRYRVGFKDVAVLAALATRQSKHLREELGLDEDDRFLIAEALERLDEADGLSDEGRARLMEFRAELRELREHARKPAAEFFGEVIRRIGLLDELEADVDRTVAQATKRNLGAFLEEVHRFEPIEGELTLGKFLDYVDETDKLDKQEWAPVQPSEDDSVKVMTIHVAKGLEFDHVFVPGFAHGLLPNPEIPQNPAERGKSLDFELRGDRDILPRYEGVLQRFKDDLREQEIVEERRAAYVALTRARRTLWLSGAYWYGVENVTPKKASRFFDELADWGERTSHATVDRGPDGPGDENPMHGLRERFVRDWPGPAAREAEADDLFASGWRLGALEAAGNGSVQPSLVDALDPGERAEFDALAAGHRELASHLREREASEGASTIPPTPPAVSVAGLHLYAECPKRFYWTSVRPLPTFRGSSARIGTEVHGWIERRASGQAPLPDLEQTPDLTSDELVGDPGKIERLQEAFLASRFAALVPRYAERAFLLSIDGFRVSGRIDAIYGEGDGPWEVVDWKTGRRPEDDPLASLQLDVYGLACVDVWGKRPADLTLTYLYLASEEEVSRPMGDADDVRTRVSETLHAIASGGFDPVPGSQCSWCDFRPFCAEGTAWVAKNKNG